MSVKKSQIRHVPLTIGADPEIFIMDRRNNQYVSAHDLFPGTKIEPFPIAGGAVQVDGVAVEFNIDPSSTKEVFLKNLASVSKVTHFMLRKRGYDYKFDVSPTAYFDKAYFDKLPDLVKELGCSPDYDAFKDGDINPKPGTDEPFRTGAGHIHVGWTTGESLEDPAHLFDCISAAKQLASILYVPSHAWDSDQKRRTLYGKMGAFRPKPYGFESRFLSNAWMRQAETAAWVFDQVKYAMQMMDEGVYMYEEPEFIEYTKSLEADPHRTLSRLEIEDYVEFLKTFGFDDLPDQCWGARPAIAA